MATDIFGIYGFNFSREVTVGEIKLVPLYGNYAEARSQANDEKVFHLTGYGIIDAEILPSNAPIYFEKIALLADALTFCEQQWVLPSDYINIPVGGQTTEYSVSKLPRSLDLRQRRPTRGPVIAEQASMRQDFLNLRIKKLEDEEFNQKTAFKKAFYRQIETLRLRNPYAEIIYYLTFSALEILARKCLSNYGGGNVAVIINPFLKQLGFQTDQKEVERWAKFRNAVFHEGQFEKEVKENNKSIKLTENNYIVIQKQLSRLLPDVLLKLMGYDDRHINWKRWRDGEPFC